MTGLTHTTLFPRASFVGFDHLFSELDHVARHAKDHYPPHNIIRIGQSDFLIELAVAGFGEDELDIEVKDRTLSITGEHISKGRDFVHRGISTKKFSILAINLKYVIPEDQRPRKINIGKNEESKNDTYNTTSKQLLNESPN